MNVWAVAVDQQLRAELYTCDSCQRARRPLFLAKDSLDRVLGFACDSCLALGHFKPHLAA